MATYKFDQFDLEIVDPTVTIDPTVQDVNPIAMTIAANVTLSTSTASFGVFLKDIAVENLDYNSETLQERIMEKLSEYIV